MFPGMPDQTAYAAQFPAGYIQIIDMGDSISQSDEGVGRGKHGEEDVP
jgi:hypothetical protein